MRDRILVVGSLNYDIIARVGHIHSLGETQSAEEGAIGCGGKGGNQAVQAAKLGKNVIMYGKVGNDAEGIFLTEHLAKYGVNAQFIEHDGNVSGLSFANVLPDGSVYSTIIHGANHRIKKEDIDRIWHLAEDAAYLVLQLEIPIEITEYIMRKAKGSGVKIVLNAAPAEKFDLSLLADCYLFVVNEVEASVYTGKAVSSKEDAFSASDKLFSMGSRRHVITLGSLGSVIAEDGKKTFVPAVKVNNAVDTTGAGDSYVGAVTAKLLEGKSLLEAAEFATRCSAVAVTRIGCQEAMPYACEIV